MRKIIVDTVLDYGNELREEPQMTDYEFNNKIKIYIDKCKRYDLSAYDLGTFLSGIYGITSNTSVRIKILLPVFLKLACDILNDESVVPKEVDGGYFSEKLHADYYSLKERENEKKDICSIIKIMSGEKIDKNSIIKSINIVLENSNLYSDPSLCMYRIFFSFIRDDVNEGKKLGKKIIEKVRETLEIVLTIR